MNGLFDSPWHILILAIVVIVLFGSAKLPVFARSLGKSARILKSEMGGMHQDEPGENDSAQASAVQPAQAQIQAAPAQPTTAQSVDTQAQIDALQRQLSDLQKNAPANGSVPADAQQTK